MAGGRPRDLPTLPKPAQTPPPQVPCGDIDELTDTFDAVAFVDGEGVGGAERVGEGDVEEEKEGWETEEDSDEEEEMADRLRNEKEGDAEGATQSRWHRAQEKRRQRWPLVRMAAVPAIASEQSGYIAPGAKCFCCAEAATHRCLECSRHRDHVGLLLP